MKLLFLAAKDLLDAKFTVRGKKTLLSTDYAEADTVAFCGRLESWQKTEDELRITLSDPDQATLNAGEYSGSALNDADGIIAKNKAAYVLAYCRPQDGRLLLQEIVEVGAEACKRFHTLAEKAREYLKENPQTEDEKEAEAFTEDDVAAYIKERDGGSGVPLDDVLSHFKDSEKAYETILDLMEAGRLMEPHAGRLKALE